MHGLQGCANTARMRVGACSVTPATTSKSLLLRLGQADYIKVNSRIVGYLVVTCVEREAHPLVATDRRRPDQQEWD